MRNVHPSTDKLWSAAGVGIALALVWLWGPLVLQALAQ